MLEWHCSILLSNLRTERDIYPFLYNCDLAILTRIYSTLIHRICAEQRCIGLYLLSHGLIDDVIAEPLKLIRLLSAGVHCLYQGTLTLLGTT